MFPVRSRIMNFKKITLSLLCGVTAITAFGQTLTSRVFFYDGTLATNGQATYVLNGDGATAGIFAGSINGTGNQNAVTGSSATNAGFLVSTIVNVSSYVYISGNFGGTFNVQGIGAGYDPVTEVNQVEVRTNRTLSFTAAGFYGIGTAGTIGYTLSLLQDYPSNGTVLAGTGASLNDAGFNGSTVVLDANTQLPLDGKATLQLTRQLYLNQSALGGKAYTAGGTIQVSVN